MPTDPATIGPSRSPDADRFGEARGAATVKTAPDPPPQRLKSAVRRLLTTVWLVCAVLLIAGISISLWNALRSAGHSMSVARLRLLGATVMPMPSGKAWPNHLLYLADLSPAGARGRVVDADLADLTHLRPLQTLNLSQCGKITDAGMQDVAAIAELKELMLGTAENPGARITDAGLEPLTRLRRLELLDLSQCGRITDEGLKHVARIPALKELHLDGGLEPGPRVGDAGLEALASLPRLTELTLAGSTITDAGLPALRDMPSLEILDLSGTAITDAGLAHLKGLPRLKVLTLERSLVTKAGVDALMATNPTLEIHRDEPGSGSGETEERRR